MLDQGVIQLLVRALERARRCPAAAACVPDIPACEAAVVCEEMATCVSATCVCYLCLLLLLLLIVSAAAFHPGQGARGRRAHKGAPVRPPGPQIYIPAWVFCMSRYVDFEFRGSAVRRLRWSENFPSGDGTKPSCMRSVARTQQEMLRFDVQYMRARFAALCRLPRPSPQLFCSADALPGSAPLSLFPKLPAACTHSRDGLRNEPLPNARDAGIHVSNIDYLRHNWA